MSRSFGLVRRAISDSIRLTDDRRFDGGCDTSSMSTKPKRDSSLINRVSNSLKERLSEEAPLISLADRKSSYVGAWGVGAAACPTVCSLFESTVVDGDVE